MADQLKKIIGHEMAVGQMDFHPSSEVGHFDLEIIDSGHAIINLVFIFLFDSTSSTFSYHIFA